MTKKIGVLSDTHGLLRNEVIRIFKGVDLILHAGDIGGADILERLQEITTVVSVKGNSDAGFWSINLQLTQCIEFETKTIYLIHDRNNLDLNPRDAGIDIIVSGHTHMPSISYTDDILYLNPGSAGVRRFKLPVSVALISIEDGVIRPEIVELTT